MADDFDLSVQASSGDGILYSVFGGQVGSLEVAQFYRPKMDMDPYERLAYELLMGAIKDIYYADTLSGTTPRRRALAKERAAEWIAGAEAPILFASVCERLHLDEDATREALLGDEAKRHKATENRKVQVQIKQAGAGVSEKSPMPICAVQGNVAHRIGAQNSRGEVSPRPVVVRETRRCTMSLKEMTREFQRRVIAEAILRTGSLRAAAEELGYSEKSYFVALMRRLNMPKAREILRKNAA